MITVLLVDDHPMVREGLRSFLEAQADLAVVGEAGDGADAIRQAEALRPDVVLLDLVMPGVDGLAALPDLKRVAPDSEVLVLTSFADDSKVFPALRAGASGYLLKTVSAEELARAIRAVSRGEPVLHPNIARRLMRSVPASVAPPPAEHLTSRELEVLALVARRLTNKEIAAELSIAEKTVKTHVSNLLTKLGLTNRLELARYAREHGLGAGE
jgi:NarL family two-component system response regulator LiaR